MRKTRTLHAALAGATLILTGLLPVSGALTDPPLVDPQNPLSGPLQKVGDASYVYRFFFKLYDAALYAPPGAETADILAATVPFRLQFRYHREIDRDIILQSAERMLEKNLSDAERGQIAERVTRLNAAYVTVREGDRSALTFKPGSGTVLTINGTPAATVPGDDFARLYFRIWLGDEPISPSLKAALLGQ